jgi:tetratricopeptide (TPR) repeat protein
MVDEALANFRKAVEYEPKNILAYLMMAGVYVEMKHDDDAAIEILKRLIEANRDSAEGHLALANLYQRKKDDAEAINYLLKAIKLNAKYLQAHLNLAAIYKTQQNYPEAVKHLSSAIEIAPTDMMPYKELAKVYEDQGKTEDAVLYYEEALKRLNANNAYVKNLYLGRIARLRGRYDEAIGYFKTVQLSPSETIGQIQYDMGLTYVASKNRAAAQEQHQQLVQLKSPLADELLKKIKEMKK